ncbi:unnamed protein product [Arabidopsis arenosa]|uniref:RBR-type E3 ubiquitin transferase n=1 Tax=Arabidopsis arenosa TaxID=38785 RepID=A0A8S2A1V6_ARAAE|nr:unnamed protein product [Arabidopsis arenosa]
MEKYDQNLISKKQRIDYATTKDIPNLKGEGCSKVAESAFATKKCANSLVYRLSFKGLVSDETTVDMKGTVTGGFGIAICDETDILLHERKESLNGAMINREEVEIIALITGLKDSIQLEFRNVMICCDDHQIYQIITGGQKPQQNIVHLVEEVQRLRGELASTEVVLVAETDVNYVLRLAREALQRKTCDICCEDTDADRMFLTDKCFHRHCFSCVKKHVEANLLIGISPTCLGNGCKFELTLESCSMVLTPKLIEMWKRKMEEDLIPAADKIYCPYPSCSKLMSKTALSRETNQSNVRACVKCCGLFCIECKVPPHPDLSCADYKKLNPEPLFDDKKLKSLANDKKWRQCVQCSQLIELREGCNHITCRCRYEFCYVCGNEWKENQRSCTSGCKLDHDDDDEDYDIDDSDDDDDDDSDDDDDDDDDGDDDDGSKYSSEAERDGINFEDFAVYQP